MTDVALRAPGSRRRLFGDLVSTLLWLPLGGLLFSQIVIWLKVAEPMIGTIEQFAVQLTATAVIGAVLALAFRRGAQVAVFAVLAVTLAWPVFAAHRPAAVVSDGARLKVVSANLWFAAPTHQPTLDMLMASDADIIGLVEVSEPWVQALAPLFAKYPYRVDCFATVPECETVLLSKLPLTKPRAERVFGVAPVVVGGEVDWNGRTFEVLATHLAWPFTPDYESRWAVITDPENAPYLQGGLPANRQTSQAGNLAKFINTLPPDVLLMGDFNGAPWSRLQRAFRTSTGLDHAAGWDFSWPAVLPWPLRLPIDHVLSRGHLGVTNFDAGPELDSDHVPVIAEIGWRD